MPADGAMNSCCDTASGAAPPVRAEGGVVDFFSRLTDTSGYPPRWSCGTWTSFEGWLHILADVATFAAYFAIPCVLLFFLLRRKDLPFPRIILLFGVFILSCGAGHLLEAVIFWHPIYRIAGLVKLLTAAVSWITVFALVRIVPKVLKWPSMARLNEQLAEEIENRKRSEAHVRAVLETAVDAVISIDAKGTIIAINRAAERMFGHSIDEMLGQNVRMLMPPPYCHEHDKHVGNYLATGKRKVIGIDREAVGLRSDGTLFPIELGVSEVRLGDECTFTGVVRDITSRKQAEEELREYNRQLQEAGERLRTQAVELERKTHDLAAAQQAAEQANHSKDEFLANMSHEIRTPMTAILGFADVLLEEDAADRSPSERVFAVQTIKRNGEHLLNLINDILDLSKIESGKLELEHIACSPAEIVADVVNLMRVPAQAKNLPVLVVADGPIPETIQSDPTRLRQVLINLVSNAIKFTELGSVRIVSRIVESQDAPPMMEFRVIDSGIGMNDEQMLRLFQPFTQADNSTTRKFGGTGLGLAISRRLVEMLDGSIQAESAPEQGTTFTVRVPTGELAGVRLVEPTAATHDGNPTSPTSARNSGLRLSGRILLAEDGVDNQRLVSFMLRKAGADVTVVENGQLACEAVRDAEFEGRPFDAVLMDMQMPVLDGYSATRRLRHDGCQTPIIALTAHAMPGDREKCLDVGCNEYATKPIERAELIALLQRFLVPAEAAGA